VELLLETYLIADPTWRRCARTCARP